MLGVDFVDQNTGWAVGPTRLIHTEDGGASWNSQSHPAGGSITLRDVEFVSPSIGWIVGEGGTILHTTDAGANWVPQVAGTSNILNAVDFLDENNGWAVGESGTIIHTNDGGATWQRQPSGTIQTLNDVVVVIPEPHTVSLILFGLTLLGLRSGRWT